MNKINNKNVKVEIFHKFLRVESNTAPKITSGVRIPYCCS